MDWMEQECAYRGQLPEGGSAAILPPEKGLGNSKRSARKLSATCAFVIGFIMGVTPITIYALNRIGFAYEKGRASVYVECAQTGHSTLDQYQLTCKASHKIIQTGDTGEPSYTAL